MVGVRTLVGIAGVGGLVTAYTGYTLNGILQKRVLDSAVYMEAMSILNNHPGIIQLLGKPVRSNRVDVGNPNNVLSMKFSTLEVPVYGPKSKGTLYIMADRMEPEDNWNIYRLELEMLDEFGGKVRIINKDPVSATNDINDRDLVN